MAGALRTLQVGGEFWARRPKLARAANIAFRATSLEDLARATPALLAAHEARALHALLPDAPWARAAAHRLAALGVGVTVGPADPWGIVGAVEAVSVAAGDELGLLGEIAGTRVCWRAPAGTDATDGRPTPSGTMLERLQDQLFGGVTYIDPFDGRPATCEATIELLADWRRQIDANRSVAACVGVARWKRREVRQLLFRGDGPVSFHTGAGAAVRAAASRGAGVAVWPSRAPKGLAERAHKAGVPVIQLEDGFIRSAGLGCNLWPPASVAADRLGAHFDPAQPSELERILAETDFAPFLARAERLIRLLVDTGVTKYNLGGAAAGPSRGPGRVVLVAGQVEDDLSVVLGGGPGSGNLDLLRRARAIEPGAYIIYKPHPDVLSGHRRGAVARRSVLEHANEVAAKVATPSLLAMVDAVHTRTSLIGFEALLRGREVIAHGQPFYSGWGLTRDLAPLDRRRRRLSLAELVAGALILYPRYVDPRTGVLCPPEVLVARLAERRGRGIALIPWLMSLQGRARGLAGQLRPAI